MPIPDVYHQVVLSGNNRKGVLHQFEDLIKENMAKTIRFQSFFIRSCRL